MIKVLLLLSIVQSTFEWIPKYVWTYWHDPIQQSSQLIKAFHNNHLQFTYGWQLRHIDKNNMWFWLGQIPNFRQRIQSEVWRGQGKAKISDMIRMGLINHFGGVYFDMTTILTRNLDWIIQMKDERLFIVNGTEGWEPDLFIHYAYHSNGPKIYDQKTKNNIPLIPNLQSFFFAGKPKNKLLDQWLQKAFQLKQQSYKLYGRDKTKSLLIQRALMQGTPVSYQTNTNYWEIIVVGGNIISNKQKELSQASKKNNQPLALRYYNIMLMNALESGYTFMYNCTYDECLSRVSLNDLKKRKIYPSHFVKLYKDAFQQLYKYTTFPNLFGKKDSYILRDSVLYQFLLKGYKRIFYSNVIVNSVQDLSQNNSSSTTIIIVVLFSTFCLVNIIVCFQSFKVKISQKKSKNLYLEISKNENQSLKV